MMNNDNYLEKRAFQIWSRVYKNGFQIITQSYLSVFGFSVFKWTKYEVSFDEDDTRRG